MRWWGWGTDADAIDLPQGAVDLLRAELGLDETAARRSRCQLADVTLPDIALTDTGRRSLVAAAGAEHVLDDRETRVLHAYGKSYPDLVRVRSGDGSGAPDVVVRPAGPDEVTAVLAACAAHGMAVVPFGGGTSVVGGVEALRGPHHAAISLDLGRMDRMVGVDHSSLTASFEAGLLGPELERFLRGSGLTLGHFPQSFEYSTVGGWVATRSAGQASTGIGRIDELVESVTCVAPAGRITTADVPASAAGPSLEGLLVGSEGTLGVITRATLRVRPLPAARHYEGWSFRSFEEGREALRVLVQADAAPDVARLSDEEETRLSMALSATGGLAERAGRAYRRARGHDGGCLAFAGFEGATDSVARRRGRAAELLRAGGGVLLGERPGRSWLRNRFAAPYLRDDMLDHGVMIETLETATTWARVGPLHQTVGEALRSALSARGTPPAVMCHISHLYRSGASLYFTFIARQEAGAEIEQWAAAKRAACDAIVAGGGTITHHHGVGRDHAPWLEEEVGALGLDILRTAKERLDPAGIMNPGKLLG